MNPLWEEARPHVILHRGLLIVDDTTLDKPYAQSIELVHRHWSGKQQRVVQGSTVVTLLGRDGTDAIACAYRLYDTPVDGVTKHAHLRAMLATARGRGLHPRLVAFDSWYSSVANLKTLRDYGWVWVTRRTGNRHVTPDGTGTRALQEVAISPDGTVVQLKGYGMILVCRIATPDGDTD